MKEKYFSSENIEFKAKNFYEKLQSFFNKSFSSYEKKNSALLVVDMQKFFSQTTSHAFIPSIEAIVPNISNLINYYRAHNLLVIFTKHVNTPKNAGLMNKRWRDIIELNYTQSEIIEELIILDSVVIEKTQYDAFYNTNLEELLKNCKVNKLVITGVMTHLCCETTARSAFVRGFENYFVIDATATYNETFHMGTLINLVHGFSTPVLTKNILESKNG
jgi:isochorismate hydrolase